MSTSPNGVMSRLASQAAVLVIAVMPAACILRNPPDAAAIKAESMTHVAVPAQWTAAGAGAGEVADNWLVEFHDDQLTAAVIEAIAHNANLQIGAARVEVAQRHAKLAGAKLYPSVDLLAKGGGDLGGDSSGIQGAILTMNWELDLWGRVRYGRAAAAADALSVQADFEFARQSIAAQVAKAWFLAIEAGLQAEVARRAITDSESLVNLAAVRVKVGAGNEEDVYVARASVGTYRDALRDIELAREQALRSLELLIGRYPSGTAAVSPGLPGQPDAVPGGLPSALLERRPDVIAAERRVAAAFNRRHEARAARLPALSLSAGISSITSDLFVLEDRENPSWSYGASLVAPIFRGGALKTQVEIRTAEQKQAVAAYADVGLRAFGEVESALAAEIAARDREKILAETLSDHQRALQVVQTQFKVGSTDLRFVTQRQLSLNATQSALVRVQTDQRVQRVNLHLALGGSFERSRSSSRRNRQAPGAEVDVQTGGQGVENWSCPSCLALATRAQRITIATPIDQKLPTTSGTSGTVGSPVVRSPMAETCWEANSCIPRRGVGRNSHPPPITTDKALEFSADGPITSTQFRINAMPAPVLRKRPRETQGRNCTTPSMWVTLICPCGVSTGIQKTSPPRSTRRVTWKPKLARMLEE